MNRKVTLALATVVFSFVVTVAPLAASAGYVTVLHTVQAPPPPPPPIDVISSAVIFTLGNLVSVVL
jgi:hypothetical protein